VPALRHRHPGRHATPKPWKRTRPASLMLLELLEAADLDDDAADEVCEILLSKLW
jgi:hypothetical protein